MRSSATHNETMETPPRKGKEQQPKPSATPTVSARLPDGTLVEMLYRERENRTLFCVAKDGALRYEPAVTVGGEKLVPYSAKNNLLKHEVVLLASEAVEYGSQAELLARIRAFIHRYVDVPPEFEEIASCYVLFTWVYDRFNELPYLRLRGDAGTGKTRFLLTVGSLCYKPIFASGASTVSPLFRILDAFQGTLLVDEGDFRFSDEKTEIVKILNNGNARGFPVLRSEAINGKEFSPRAFSVFGPKLVATRGYFEDRALESRCLTENTGGRSLRTDIPLNLTEEYREESLALRNQLLMYRLRTLDEQRVDPALVDHTIEPRLAQVFLPLLSVIQDDAARQTLFGAARTFNRELVAERGMDREAAVLEVVKELRESAGGAPISVKAVAIGLAERVGDDWEKKITPHWVGHILRKKLGLRTEKRHGSFIIAETEGLKLASLFTRYGIGPAAGDLGDSGDFKSDVILGT